MNTITVQAVYRGGVLKPATQLNLPEGATVEVQVTPVTSFAKPTAFGSLAGIWSHLIDADLDRLEQGLAEIRRQSAERLEVRYGSDHHRNPG